ncbi:zf-TFIIB domain-containing protein [Leptolyngbya cf. ectocarpi LEGE 11479]|uniref:Zf-TFIIB domain-containing protein n=1 Tax=Leptolyngbya cf. ectocarpi LEGE 11479 TaxID=1828722 RepID=A0A928X3L2_LEPEC|nr:zf-TFIIB domain-containing protein [Leptolyngbya ectocarpi]MBE9065918.1 zf-TFIIB domain-containing protein [Leptolyngbya cf. ectocarpi LEGE 11479]
MHNTTEPQYSCPVCPGLPLQKLKIIPKESKNRRACLTLDCCQRCGGVWFDKNEVTLSKQITSLQDRQRITQKSKKGQIHCHRCDTPMDRNLDQCPACDQYNRIACPVCKRTLARKQHRQLALDVCQHCQGVWFDQAELLAIWNGPLPAFLESCDRTSENSYTSPNWTQFTDSNATTQTTVETAVEGSVNHVAANILYDSGLQVASSAVQGSAEAAGATMESLAAVTSAALETAGELPEVATVVVEATAEMAGGLIETLAAIIAAMFSG